MPPMLQAAWAVALGLRTMNNEMKAAQDRAKTFNQGEK